jgi:hypothetical protein
MAPKSKKGVTPVLWQPLQSSRLWYITGITHQKSCLKGIMVRRKYKLLEMGRSAGF